MKHSLSIVQQTIPPAPVGKKWIFVPGKPAADWKKSFPENGIPFEAAGTFDLDTLRGGGNEMDECVLYQKFESETEGEFLLGAAADWWFELALNGAIEGTTMPSGNQSTLFTAEDHRYLVKLRKGTNLLALHIRRGLHSGLFACGGTEKQLPQPKVILGPWLSSPDTGRMSIRFLTNPGVAGGTEYRRKGETQWQEKWHSIHGVLLRSDAHEIALEGLVPGAEYEYRLLLRTPDFPLNVVRDGNVYAFRAPDAVRDTLSFLFTADLQYSKEQQQELVRKMFTAADYESADFFVLGGDMVEYQNIRIELLDGMIRYMIDCGAAEKPLINVRGNHEMRGAEADLFHEFFALPSGRTCGIFRYGSTAFLVLDCGEDKPGLESKTTYTQFNLDREFFREEKEFLEEALKRPAWKEAKRRIVLAHGATYSNRDNCLWQPFRLQKMTDAWFHGKKPLYPLDLWLCGHSHVHLRSIPGTNVLAAPVKPPAPHRTGENDIYPVLTVGGPSRTFPVQASVYRVDIAADRITVRAYDQDGKMIDHVIYEDGKEARELMQIPHFSVPADPEPDLYYAPDDPQ